TGGRGVDVVLDLVGGDYLPASLEVLATRGRLMLVGSLAGRSATVDLSTLLRRRLTVRGTVLRARPLEEKIMVARHFAAHVVPLLAAGTVHPVVDAVFPLEAAAEAYARLASNRVVGKVVLSMG
ncbi:MAG TPA: zinc-binding dehydrogenase, partial [Gemmatimonadaceae bacterium]|nr:zinc-binding dehydrogenase [Gemmatimonadaceae bacterium]